jgi:hypothetical protein
MSRHTRATIGKSHLSVVEEHIVVRKDWILERQAILDAVSNNKSAISWISKVNIEL